MAASRRALKVEAAQLDPRKAQSVDRQALMRAVDRVGQTGVRLRSASGLVATGKEHPAPQVEQGPAHISRTVRPVRQMIRCYDCGYEFPLTVRVKSTYCPKCRATLDFIDYTIESEWTETLKTEGSIRIAPLGVLKEGKLVANDVIIEGRAEGGMIQAFRRIDINAGAVFDEKKISAQDLRIGAGAIVTLQNVARYRNVEVAGTLNADLRVSGMITVKAGGLVRGKLHGSHLVVEEGGGLLASVWIEEAKEPATPVATAKPAAAAAAGKPQDGPAGSGLPPRVVP